MEFAQPYTSEEVMNQVKGIFRQIGWLFLFAIFCSFSLISNGDMTILTVATSQTTNNGLPFYVYVKEVEKGEFLRHEYQQIAQEAFAETSPIEPFLIFPGKNHELKVTRTQKQKPLGIYALYTAPGEEWKAIASGAYRINLVLGETEIQSATRQ
jgi:hypothetical protein